jgi:uridine kinase
MKNHKNNISIRIHGPTASGKSTIAAKILSVLSQEGFEVNYVGMDDVSKKEANCANIVRRTHVTIYELQERR